MRNVQVGGGGGVRELHGPAALPPVPLNRSVSMEVFNLPLPSNDGVRPNVTIYIYVLL
jgi:hypothetical protein